MRKFIYEIGKYKTLNKKEERVLLVQYKKHGDMKAFDLLIRSNMRYVIYIVFRTKLSYNIDDVIQCGMIGLMKAVQKFDLSYNVRLITFATLYIYREMYLCVGQFMSDFASLDAPLSNDSDKEFSMLDVIGFEDESFDNKCRSGSGRIILKEIERRFGSECVSLLRDYYLEGRRGMDFNAIYNAGKIRKDKRLAVLYKKFKNDEL
jgi:DNA-directed RNA polymerase sigma subunit (sigma70/sigma32)